METTTLLENSNLLVIQTIDDLKEVAWEMPGVYGEWSVKDTIAHLASYERVTVDVLNTFQGQEISPDALRWLYQRTAFDRDEVAERRYWTAQQVEDEYQDLQVQATSLLALLPVETIQRPGTLPWYTPDESLADFIREISEHIQEACTHITQFRQREDIQAL